MRALGVGVTCVWEEWGLRSARGQGRSCSVSLIAFHLCPHKLSLGGDLPQLWGDADFGPWPLSRVSVRSPIPQNTGGPGCLRKEKDKGREGARRQVRASMGSCDSVVCTRLVPG